MSETSSGAVIDRRKPRRVDILGVQVSAVDLSTSVAIIAKWVESGQRHYVCVTGAHGVTESLTDPALRATHNASGLTVPDGMPMVWAGRLVGLKEIGHVRGAELMRALLEQSVHNGWRNYFYGGAPGVADTLVARMQKELPGLLSVGTCSPPFRPLTDEEDAEIVQAINAADPDLVWVGLSTPKQERWMAAHRDRLHAAALLGVGAAFDMHAGLVTQAPVRIRESGFEWLFRLMQEPQRLWRRYLLGHTRFLGRVLISPPRAVVGPSRRKQDRMVNRFPLVSRPTLSPRDSPR